MVRLDGREQDELRSITVQYDIAGNADGSVLFSQGNTRVLCTVKCEEGVPRFLRGTGTGWLTAEYAMLPGSTHTRSVRDMSQARPNKRSIEISRLLGRSLRAIVDLDALGEKTIYVDCDIVQADGGTRTASLSAAYCALKKAQEAMIQSGVLNAPFLIDTLGAVSVGLIDGSIYLDINYEEDTRVDADFNFVMTGSGKLIEIQGATENRPLDWQHVLSMQQMAQKGIATILSLCHTKDEQ